MKPGKYLTGIGAGLEHLISRLKPKDQPTPQSKTADLPVKNVWSGWILNGILALTAAIFLIAGATSKGLILAGLSILYPVLGIFVLESPEEGVLFRFGAMICRLKPGFWHLPILFIHRLEHETTARQILNQDNPEKEKHTLYYTVEIKKSDNKEEIRVIPVTVYMRVYFQLVNVRKAIQTYGGLGTEESRLNIEGTAFAALRAKVGANGLIELLREKERVTGEIRTTANTELKNTGYEIAETDLYDYEESVKTAADEIRELGLARAEEAGAYAAAVAGPFKDNYPAAIASAATALANAGRDIARSVIGPKSGKTDKGTEKKGSEQATFSVDALKGALDALTPKGK